MEARVSNRRGRLLNRLVLAAAAIPFAASLGFHSVERAARTPRAGSARPSLVFDQYLVNLGEVHNTPRAEAIFRFKNCGSSPVRITRVEPSCGCLSPTLEKRTYAPGEVCEFTLGVLTTSEAPGPHDYTLAIDYEDPQPRSTTLAFKLVVTREVAVRPPGVMFYQNGTQESERTIVVSDMRPKPFRVTGATCASPLVHVQVQDPVDRADEGRETSVVIRVAAQIPPSGVRTAVRLTVDDPTYPPITIPVWAFDINSPASHPQRQDHRAASAKASKSTGNAAP